MNIKTEDNFSAIEAIVNRHLLISLERCGLEAESNAKEILTNNNTVDTSALRNRTSRTIIEAHSDKVKEMK